ncbi:MAG: hypothetical protein D6798_18200 [Deltaproteobacteria bacterium]|nr:MAG: hypothetical protein D6798_18200 [Deltaproteobacteria bacterium]
MTSAGLALLLGMACGAARRGPVDPPPAWQSEQGRLQTRLDVANALVDNGSPEAGLQMLSELRDEGVKDVSLDLAQARALAKMGLTDDARDLLLELVDRHPRLAEAHDQLGVLALDTHDLDTAIEHLQQAATLAPDDAGILNNLGFALTAAGRPDDAIPVLRSALRRQSSDDRIRNNLGFALVAAGRDAEALRVFRAGLPEVDARYNLGLGLELRGDIDAAIEQYVAVLTEDPGHAAAREGLRRLRPDSLHLVTTDASPSSPEPQ